jgi:hypothetical protein
MQLEAAVPAAAATQEISAVVAIPKMMHTAAATLYKKINIL